jgi:hypothetical protein
MRNPLPVGVDKAEWTVVDGEGEEGHVVGVENPVGEPHRLPGGDQMAGLLADLAKHRNVAFLKASQSFKLQVGQTSVSDPDWIRIQSGQWIRIRIRNPDLDPDPDPEGQNDSQK